MGTQFTPLSSLGRLWDVPAVLREGCQSVSLTGEKEVSAF